VNPHARVEGSRSMPARLLLGLFGGWQRVRAGRPSPCRFVPTCSAYGIEAVEQHGALRGGALAARRVLRCHPWGRFGYDPVPDRGGRPHTPRSEAV
jgi:putative membrane protein insertion efficiency factor